MPETSSAIRKCLGKGEGRSEKERREGRREGDIEGGGGRKNIELMLSVHVGKHYLSVCLMKATAPLLKSTVTGVVQLRALQEREDGNFSLLSVALETKYHACKLVV